MTPRKMNAQNEITLKLRAHHICCVPFLTHDFSDRGIEYLQVGNRIKQTLSSEPDSTIMVIEGADELCKVCPLCQEDRCQSPLGDEEAVRKWDAVLLKELGLSYGKALKVRQWQSLINKKRPFRLCQRCQWRKACSVSA
jgi:hypothetical protein